LIKPYLRKLFTGLSIPQQYICLGAHSFTNGLCVKAIFPESPSVDVTKSHVFLGYKPVIISLSFESSDSAATETVCKLEFGTENTGDGKVATLSLRRIRSFTTEDCREIVLYEGIGGSHLLISPVHQLINNLREKLKSNTAGNVSLDGNLYDQVRIAYSVPRDISLVTVKDGERMNVFPTDLHGQSAGKTYLSSLRINGKATGQVEKYRDVVICEMDAAYYKKVYDLGKNHMKDLHNEADFDLSGRSSSVFGHPLPSGTLAYRELRLKDSFDCGIHRVHLYNILSYERIEDGNPLVHIHQYYAEWRKRNSYETELLLR
jgi:flavin reductase (DIM6/NTAB) family NADH-FMN oxidoreductase RutF